MEQTNAQEELAIAVAEPACQRIHEVLIDRKASQRKGRPGLPELGAASNLLAEQTRELRAPAFTSHPYSVDAELEHQQRDGHA